MVDVGGDDGAAAGHLVTHEFGRDDLGDAGPQAIALQAHFAVQVGLVLGHPLTLAVLAQGDVLHFGRDDALACIVHLRDVAAGLGAARLALQGSGFAAQHFDAFGIALVQLAAIVQDVVQTAFVGFAVAACLDPLAAHRGQALAHVDGGLGIGVGA